MQNCESRSVSKAFEDGVFFSTHLFFKNNVVCHHSCIFLYSFQVAVLPKSLYEVYISSVHCLLICWHLHTTTCKIQHKKISVQWPVHVPPCTWKHALNTQHTPTHDMLPHPLHYWNVHIYSDFSQDHKCSLRMTSNTLSKHVGAIRVF